MDDKSMFLLRQETLYWESSLLKYRWYRKLYGGHWFLITIYHKDFFRQDVWTKIPKGWSNVERNPWEEQYPETGADTKFKLIKQLFIQLWRKLF